MDPIKYKCSLNFKSHNHMYSFFKNFKNFFLLIHNGKHETLLKMKLSSTNPIKKPQILVFNQVRDDSLHIHSMHTWPNSLGNNLSIQPFIVARPS